jgi:Mce-associated membrane protein
MPRPLPRALRGAGDASSRGPAEPSAGRPSPRPRPRPHPVDDAPPAEDSAPGRRSLLGSLPALGRRTVAALTVLALVLAGVAGVLAWQDHRAVQTARAADEALTAARTGAETLFSYDHRTIDADLAASRKVVTGKLAGDFTATSAVVKPQAVANRAVVDATVSQAGVVSADPGRVVVLVFLNQVSQNKNVQGSKLDIARVRMTMLPVDGNWRIARAEPL